MNAIELCELTFWQNLCNQHGNRYTDFRVNEYEEKTKFFQPFWDWQEGKGIDIGCGLVSVFDDCGKDITCIDPLMDEYNKIVPSELLNQKYKRVDAEHLQESFDKFSFDFAVCINMIDHTPNPELVLDGIDYILKPNGKFYFEVNFDDELGAPHYKLWNKQIVDEFFKSWKNISFVEQRLNEYKQTRYWAIYERGE